MPGRERQNAETPERVFRFHSRSIFTAGPCFFVGQTGTGKTNTMLSIVAEHAHKFETVVAFSGSVSSVATLRQCIPETFIYHPWDNRAIKMLNDLIEVQGRSVYEKRAKPLLLIFDDLMFDEKFPSSNEFKWLVFNGRGMRIWSLFTLQYCKQVPPGIRMQGFYAFLGRETNEEALGLLYSTFASGFRNQAHFERVLNEVTRDKTSLVIDKSTLGADGEDHPTYTWYRPGGVIDYKIRFGSGSCWRYHARRFNDAWARDSKAFRITRSPEARRRPGRPPLVAPASVDALRDAVAAVDGSALWAEEMLRVQRLHGREPERPPPAPRAPRGRGRGRKKQPARRPDPPTTKHRARQLTMAL
jgi:hypothetical protein